MGRRRSSSCRRQRRRQPDHLEQPRLDPGTLGVLLVDVGAAGHAGALLRAVRPEAVFISAGADNRFGHPAAQTLARIRQSGAAVYRTDLSGTITIRG